MNNAEIERITDLHDLALNCGGMSLSGKIPLRDMAVRLAQIVIDQAAEIERLTACLKTANSNHEHFEREWYLRGDEIERLRELVAICDKTVELYDIANDEGRAK